MSPDPTWLKHTSDLQKIRPGYFLTRPEEIFFDLKGNKLKNLTFLGEIFQIQTKTIDGWLNPTQAAKFWPGPITTDHPLYYLFISLLALVSNNKLRPELFVFQDSFHGWKLNHKSPTMDFSFRFFAKTLVLISKIFTWRKLLIRNLVWLFRWGCWTNMFRYV